MDQQPPPAPQPVETMPPAAPPPTPPAGPAPSSPAPASPAPAWQADQVPAGPAPGVEFAGYGARLVAYIIDGIILGVVIMVITFALVAVLAATVSSDGDVSTGGALFTITLTIVILLISILYFPYFWQKNGRTPGMSMFGIRVVRDADGGPIGWGAAILRYIGFIIDSIILGLPIGFLWVFVDKRRRAWHDLIGGTVVIKG